MTNSIRLRFIAVLLAPLLFMTGCATAADETVATQRIIAIGDLHGDYDAYEALMLEAALIDDRGRWTGGEAVFVQTGDIADRGPDSKKIIDHLRKLKKQAARKGGDVITLVGNHEAMNMTGDLRYIHPGEYEAFITRDSKKLRDRIYDANRDAIEAAYLAKDETMSREDIKSAWEEATPLGMIEHQRAWGPDGEIGEWVVANPAVTVIGDALFVHGGISPAVAEMSIETINAEVAAALKERSSDPESIINREDGPLWYRGLITPLEDFEYTAEETIEVVLDAYDVDHIVVGHTPSLSGVTSLYNGKVIQIDTGIAEHYGGTRSFLEITDGKLFAYDNGVVTELLNGGNE